MEAWYPSPVPQFQLEASSAAGSSAHQSRSRNTSQPVAHTEYAVSATMSPPSSQRSSHSPPPFDVAQPLETESRYSHDPELYAYLPHESASVPIVVSSGEQLQYHQWELNQLIGSSQANSPYLSEYPSTPAHAAPPRYNTYPVAYDAAHLEHESISGYASCSSPPSNHVQRASPYKHNRQNHFEENYDVIHQIWKPLSSEYQSSGYQLSGHSSHWEKDPQQPLYSEYLPIGQFDSMRSAHPRPGPKKKTKENVKRFPCPDCGRMFARAFNMETHRKTHIGYRPHGCPKCNKSFSRRHDLHRHLAAVHKDYKKIPLVTSKPVSPSSFNTICV